RSGPPLALQPSAQAAPPARLAPAGVSRSQLRAARGKGGRVGAGRSARLAEATAVGLDGQTACRRDGPPPGPKCTLNQPSSDALVPGRARPATSHRSHRAAHNPREHADHVGLGPDGCAPSSHGSAAAQPGTWATRLSLLLGLEMAQYPDVCARFKREARLMFRIKSEHIARVLDLGVLEDGTTPTMV